MNVFWILVLIIAVVVLYFSSQGTHQPLSKKWKKVYKSQTGNYIQKYLFEKTYNQNKRMHILLDGYPHFPHLINSNDKTLEIEIEDVGRKIRKDEVIPNFYQQISEIQGILNQLNLIHGDVKSNNMAIKDGQIYLFDFDFTHTPPRQKRTLPFKSCFDLPPVFPEDTWNSYTHRNPCMIP